MAKDMTRRPLGKAGFKIPVVGLGTMSWPGCNYGQDGHRLTDEEYHSVAEIVEAAMDAGMTLFDTAEGYGLGLAEQLLGRVLETSGRRAEALIVTKTGPLFGDERVEGRVCDLSAAHIIERCEGSLGRLRTDYIDLYLAHWPDPQTPIEETMRAAATLQEQGKIRAFGVSNFPNALLGDALKHGVVAANQLPYSLVDRELDADKRPFCKEHEVAILAYSPMGKGVLSGKYDERHLPPADDYRHQRKHFEKANQPRNFAIAAKVRECAERCGCTPAQLALAWILAQPGLTAVLPGAKSAEQAKANAAAGGISIPPEVLRELGAVSEA
jgi:aryl-alcohol dehydrogenase-like predicted oxidoreductase